jgi:hypothetical protein
MERKDELHQLLTALCFGLALLNSTAQAQNSNHQWGNNSSHQAQAKAGAAQAKTATPPADLKETQVLLKHDELLPTLNRTSAMRYEAENGHLGPGADEQIKPYLPKPKPPAIKQSRFHKVDSVHVHVPHQLTQTYR